MHLRNQTTRFKLVSFIDYIRITIVECYSYLLMVALILGIFLTSYTGKKATEILSFNLEDGHCRSGVEGVGKHCFGDFYYSLNYALDSNPWLNNVNMYPPVSNFFFKPFSLIRNHIPVGNLALVFYYVICLMGIILVIRDLAKWFNLGKPEIAQISVFIFTSAPILAAIDRGNNQLFLLPMIYWFYKYSMLENTKRAFFIGLLLVLFKPHFILLGLFILRHQSVKKFIHWSLVGGFSSLMAFILYPRGIATNFQTYVNKLIGFQNYIPAGTMEVPNLSLPNTIVIFQRFFNILIFGSDIPLQDRTYPGLIFTVITLLLATIALAYGGTNDTKLKTLLFCTLIPLSLPNIVFGYYLVGLIPFYLIYFAQVKNSQSKADLGLHSFFGLNRFSSILVLSLLIFGFIPWQIPWSTLPIPSQFAVGDISVSWFLAQLSLALLLLSFLVPNLIAALRNFWFILRNIRRIH